MRMNKSAVNIFLKIPSTWIAEIVAKKAFDFITIDMQHGLIDYQLAYQMLQVLNNSKAKILVRVPWNTPSIIMKMLDAGAHGIICPMINTGEEAQQFINACLYPPKGERSYGPIRAKLTGSYSTIEETNQKILTLAMIETIESMRNLENIAKTNNLKGLYVGPSDLSISMGLKKIADFTNKELISALKLVVEKCKAYNLISAIQVNGVHEAAIAHNIGFDIITPYNDSALINDALTSNLELVKNELLKQ